MEGTTAVREDSGSKAGFNGQGKKGILAREKSRNLISDYEWALYKRIYKMNIYLNINIQRTTHSFSGKHCAKYEHLK